MHTSEFHAKNRLLSFLIVGVVMLFAVAAQAKTASEIFEAVSPSIVVVKTYDAKGKDMGIGSGVALADGLIVTNCHVIKGAVSMKVDYRKTEYPATPRQTDWDRDVCTLVVKGLQAPPATLGATNRLKVGQQVYAVGAPQGLDLTLSNGIVSSLRPVDGGQYLQITAPISPGSSGGGLFDDEGRLIGLPTFYLAEGQQLNFAVPVEWIKELPKRQTTSPQKTTQGTAQNSKSATIDWLNKAIALKEKKDWQGLQAHALRWTKAMPKNSDAWFDLGNAYNEIKQYPKAIEAYQQAIRINPEDAMAWHNLGIAYYGIKQYPKAIEAYQQAIRVNPEYARAWYNLGCAYDKSGQYPKTIEAYQQAIRINPENADAWNNLGNAYYGIKQYPKAIEAYQQAIRINPEYAGVWNNLGNAYDDIKQYPKAIEAYQQAIRINPENADAWYNLGSTYDKSGQYPKAIEAYQQAIRINPEDAGAWNILGDAYFQLGQYPKAIEAHQQAIRVNPGYVSAWFLLGIAYKLNGQTGKVMEVYKRLKILDQDIADKFFNKIVLP